MTRLHHHHHSGGALAAEAGSGRALAVSPRLVEERLSVDTVPVCSLHGGGAASVLVEVSLWDGHEIDGAAPIERSH